VKRSFLFPVDRSPFNTLSTTLSKLLAPCYKFYVCGRQYFISALETIGILQATHALCIIKMVSLPQFKICTSCKLTFWPEPVFWMSSDQISLYLPSCLTESAQK